MIHLHAIEKNSIGYFFAGLLVAAICNAPFTTAAQGNVHQQSTQYEWPTDPLVKNKLEQWRDQKLV
ncbi:MAG: hypothetical protein ABIQ88_05920 [Chitinophagaceae bacterium]